MKNIGFLLIFILALLSACTDKKQSQSSDNELSTTAVESVVKTETENETLEQIEGDIEKTTKELDELLKDLDN